MMRVPQEVEVGGLSDGDGDLLALLVVEGECSVEVVGVDNVLVVFPGESEPVLPQAVDVGVMVKEDGIGSGVLVDRHFAHIDPDMHGAMGSCFHGAHAHATVVAESVLRAVPCQGRRSHRHRLCPQEMGILCARLGEVLGCAFLDGLEFDDPTWNRGTAVAVRVVQGRCLVDVVRVECGIVSVHFGNYVG